MYMPFAQLLRPSLFLPAHGNWGDISASSACKGVADHMGGTLAIGSMRGVYTASGIRTLIESDTQRSAARAVFNQAHLLHLEGYVGKGAATRISAIQIGTMN